MDRRSFLASLLLAPLCPIDALKMAAPVGAPIELVFEDMPLRHLKRQSFFTWTAIPGGKLAGPLNILRTETGVER